MRFFQKPSSKRTRADQVPTVRGIPIPPPYGR
nr:MAG TPA: hypothetical protein [Caudoviricetes sp.]